MNNNMPVPFSAISKIDKAEIGKYLEETIEVDGRTIKRGDLLEFEVEKGLGFGKSQEDIMKKLKEQGVNVASNYVKQRMAVARGRKPIKGDRPDPRYAKMEANYIIQRELDAGKTWEEISSTLLASGFNGPKLTEVARNNYTKKMQQQSPPAVIDNGESGPMAPEEQEPVFRPYASPRKPASLEEELAAAEQVLADNKKTDEEWQAEFQAAANEGADRFNQALKDMRAKSGAENAANPRMAEMVEMIRSMKAMPSGARFMQGQGPTNNSPEATRMPQNLDVPLGPEPEN
jgi:hypothetical protein